MASACTSRCATIACARSTLSSIVGTTTIVRVPRNQPVREVEAHQTTRADEGRDQALDERGREVAGGQENQQRGGQHHDPRGTVPVAYQAAAAMRAGGRQASAPR